MAMSFWWVALAVTLAAAADCDAERQLLSQRFGAHVVIDRHKPCAVRADFNGDGTPDVAILVRLASEPAALPASITRANPLRASGRWNGAKRGLAIAISLSDQEFLASPMWQHQPNQLLSKVPKAKAPRAAKGDGLGVATEGGPELPVYWNGSAWRFEAPNETP